MKQPILICAMLLAASAPLAAQAPNQPGPYQGTSNPPPDDSITTQGATQAPPQKPSPSHRASAPAATTAQPSQIQQNQNQLVQSQQDRDNEMPVPTSTAPQSNFQQPTPASGPDSGMVQVAPPDQLPSDQPQSADSTEPQLNARPYHDDPDGDIVHPVAHPGEALEGTRIRARLLDELSTNLSQSGDPFRATIAADVLENGQVLIPAGAEIDGIVARASAGRAGGHGTLLLRPQSVVLSNGQRFNLYAQVSGVPGSRTRVNGEGVITANTPVKKDSFEYGGGVGAGVVTGAVLGGPVGALVGGMVGAGAVTVHLMMDHPQATLETGTVLLFTLTEPLDLVAAGPPSGN